MFSGVVSFKNLPDAGTILYLGDCAVVDGGLMVAGKMGAGGGDSVVVTEEGYEILIPYPHR